VADPDTALRRAAPPGGLVAWSPGLAIVMVAAAAATVLGEVLGGPRMLYALLAGMALVGVADHARLRPGVDAASSLVLRIGVMLLGAGVTLADLRVLGPWAAGLAVMAVAATLIAGYWIGRAFRLERDHAMVSAGSVAICGASAALAVSSVLPGGRRAEAQLGLTIAAVTVLSTVAMVLYPLLAERLGFTDVQAGVFFGAAIHDVAQVVAAGHIVSPEAAEAAAIVKLMRVACLVPAVLVIALLVRRSAGPAPSVRAPLLPWFLIGFAGLAAAGAAGLIPTAVAAVLGEASRWCLLAAVAAIGMKTPLGGLVRMGAAPLAALIAQTLFIAGLALTVIALAPGL
jgi:uncharacterized integral membrane protein (TIGR00698 family)